MYYNKTYDFNHIATYAHAVKPDLNLVVFYPSNSTNISNDNKSQFVSEMHKLNLTVHVSATGQKF